MLPILRGKVVGNDQVAITAALNVSHELRECRQQLEANPSNTSSKGSGGNLVALRKKIDDVLGRAVNQNNFTFEPPANGA